MDQTERIDAFDNQMIADAHAAVAAAHNTLEFVRAQMTRKYKMNPGDQIEPDGAITRKPAAPEGGGNG